MFLMSLKNLILKTVVLFFLHGKEIYYVTGMRRSGNHAFIRWLTNALEERHVKFIQSADYPHFNYSDTRSTVFLNEINWLTGNEYLKMIWCNRNFLAKCQYLIISTEDCTSNYINWRIPKFKHAIYVKRTLLNVVASRIRMLQNQARKGIGLGWRHNVNNTFFKKLLSWVPPPVEFHIWKYDKWIISTEYRSNFLHSLELAEDIQPTISSEGGGSSFTGENETPSPKKALNRFRQVKFVDSIIALLTENKQLLTPLELEYLEKEYSLQQKLT